MKMIFRLPALLFCALVFCHSTLASAEDSSAPPQTAIETAHNFNAVSDSLLTAGQVLPEHMQSLSENGVQLVINLAPASLERNHKEGYLVAEQGISYVNIPVDWENPKDEELALFFAVMEGRENRKTLVHCFANYRASAFTYLYRVLKAGEDETAARQDLTKVWSEEALQHSPKWREMLNRHLSAAGEYPKI